MSKSVWLMAGLLVSTATCYAQSSSETPSLNDLAKRSKSGHKPVLVITDENLPIAASNQPITQTGNGPGTAAASGTSAGNTAPASAQALQRQDKNDSAAPTTTDQRTSEMKQKLASYQKEQDGWKSSVKRYEDLLATETNDFRRQMYEDALENDKHNIALYQQKIDEVQGELSKAQQASHQGGSGQSDSSTTPSGGSQL